MYRKLTLNPYHSTIDSNSFFKVINTSPEDFKTFIEMMDFNELEYFKDLIHKINNQVNFDEIGFYDKDWFGRQHLRFTILFPNGKMDWAVLATFEMANFFLSYQFGVYNCQFTYDDLIEEINKTN